MEEVDELLIIDKLLFALRKLLCYFLGQRLLPRHELRIAAKQDVGPAAGHVGCDGHRPAPSRLRDDLGFLRVIFRVQDDVLDAVPLEHA